MVAGATGTLWRDAHKGDKSETKGNKNIRPTSKTGKKTFEKGELICLNG